MRRAAFYCYEGDRDEHDIDNLWAVFETALLFSASDTQAARQAFSSAYDKVLNQKGVRWNITMALYWIRPYDFINLDSRSRWFLRNPAHITANASEIAWQLDDKMSEMLPVMKTDIMLTHGEKTLMIDAKYYAHSTQRQFGKHTLHSGNLYQIFTYVKNKEAELADKPHEVSGMLLYAKTDEDIYPENEYRMSGNRIAVRTLDLDGDFAMIREQLNGIVERYFGIRAV